MVDQKFRENCIKRHMHHPGISRQGLEFVIMKNEGVPEIDLFSVVFITIFV